VQGLTSVGITGTLAVLGAAAAHIDLYDQFAWDVSDFRTALQINAVLLILECGLLAPTYYQPDRQHGTNQTLARPLPTSPASQEAFTQRFAQFKPLAKQLSSSQQQPNGWLNPSSIQAFLAVHQAVASGPRAVAQAPQSSFALDLGLVALRDLARELLQRGLALTFLALWLRDRGFEAGLDDVAATLQLPGFVAGWLAAASQAAADAGDVSGAVSSAGTVPVPVYTSDLARWVSAFVVTTAMMPAVLTESKAVSLAVASNVAVITTQDTDETIKDPLIQEWRLMEAIARQVTAWPARLAYSLTAARGVLRFSGLNIAFALTGNLAASLAVALTSDLLIVTYCRLGTSRAFIGPAGGSLGKRTDS